MKFKKLPIYAITTALMTAPAVGLAWDHDDDEEIPFEEARLFFELNDTDFDLGIHGKIDGEEWKYLSIEDPHDRKMLSVWVRGRLRRQGLTELFFESAEPELGDEEDQLDPDVFFARFPEGEYDIEGYTLDWEERESEVYLSHVIPAAPDGVEVNGTEMASLESCEGEEGADPIPVVAPETPDEIITISWDPVVMSHAKRWAGDLEKTALGEEGPEINGDGADIRGHVRYYEVVVEIDETDFKQTAIIPGDEDTEWDITDDFFELAETNIPCSSGYGHDGEMCGQYKYEILVRTNVHDGDGFVTVGEGEDEDELPGNKSAVESCFLVPEDVDADD